MNNLPVHIRISVEAVGGPDSELGQEMLTLLAERENIDLSAREEQAPSLPPPAIESPPSNEQPNESILGPELEQMFQRVFTQAPSVPPEDPAGQ